MFLPLGYSSSGGWPLFLGYVFSMGLEGGVSHSFSLLVLLTLFTEGNRSFIQVSHEILWRT